MAEANSIRATLVELFTRIIPLNKENSKEVYWNGANNLYPNEIERVINNSPTGCRSASMLAKFISGIGVTDYNGNVVDYEQQPIVNKKKGKRISDIIDESAKTLSRQSGVFMHVGYSINEDGTFSKQLTVLDYTKCRIGIGDDDGNDGRIYVKDFEKKEKFGSKKSSKWYYPFNDNPDVIRAQIKADAGASKYDPNDIIKYRGQVYYLNATPEYRYALSRFDSVFNDMDTEYRMGLYTNTETRIGFMGKTIFVTQGLSEEQAKQTKEDLAAFMGSEGSANMYHMDVAHADDITKVVHTVQLKAQFDDKLFDVTEKRLRRNILGAANNIPEELVYTSSSVFDGGAEKYRELKKFYSEQTESDRASIEKMLHKLGFDYFILPIIQEAEEQVSDKQADAQAQLKGSVGGVTALIQLQESVSKGFTTRPSAVQILETIYGIDRDTAEKMIGNPIEAPITENQNVSE